MEMPPIRYAHARDGTRIAYTVIPGTSPPWLHLYSLGAPPIELDLSIGARLGYIRNLAHGRATVLFDHRGSGFSGPIRGELTLDDLVDDLAAVTDAVGEPLDVSIMGTGFLVALPYLVRGAPLWRSLLLHGPVLKFAGSYQDSAQAIWRETNQYTETLRMATRVSMDVPAHEFERVVRRWSELVPEETAAAYRSTVLDVDLASHAHKVAIPALITTGWPRTATQAEVAAAMPGAVLATLSSVVNRPELGAEVRALWEAYVLPTLKCAGHIGPEPMADLSLREGHVLRLLAQGYSNAEIAAELVLATRTVERHVQNIYNKLGVHNRVEAANWSREHGGI